MTARFLGPSAVNEHREDWELVGGVKLRNVHPREDCTKPCPIHDPTDHLMVNWPQDFGVPDENMVNDADELWTPQQVMVRRCHHGNYHVDPDSTARRVWRVWDCLCWCCREEPQQKLGGT